MLPQARETQFWQPRRNLFQEKPKFFFARSLKTAKKDFQKNLPSN